MELQANTMVVVVEQLTNMMVVVVAMGLLESSRGKATGESLRNELVDRWELVWGHRSK